MSEPTWGQFTIRRVLIATALLGVSFAFAARGANLPALAGHSPADQVPWTLGYWVAAINLVGISMDYLFRSHRIGACAAAGAGMLAILVLRFLA